MSTLPLTPPDMLYVRNRVRKALELEGFEFTGGGVSMVDPSADLDVEADGQRFNISIKHRGAVPAKKAA